MTQIRTLPMDVLMEQITELLNGGSSVQIKAKGYSMMPFIRHEIDSMNLKLLDSVEEGDIVLAHLPEGRYVAHRVIAVNGDALTLKGDGNLDATEHCYKSSVCGTVVEIVRPSGHAIDCRSDFFLFISKIWRCMPRLFRRGFLSIFRRLFL